MQGTPICPPEPQRRIHSCIQVKQKDKVGRPDIDSFEAMMMREDCDKGFFVAFDYSSDALTEETSKEMRRVHFIPEDQHLWHPTRFQFE
jgi:hypothetical protein